MPFSDIFVEALTKVSASRKAYLRHLYAMKKTHLFRHQRYSHPNRTIAGKSFRAVSASFSVFQFRRSKYRKQRHPNDPLFG